MRPEVRRQLYDINRRFYACYAEAFGQSRSRAWPGFARITRPWTTGLADPAHPPAHPPDVRVLDIGCGNGRFGLHLASYGDGPRAVHWHYRGVDGEPALLEQARQALEPHLEAGFLAAVDLGHFDLESNDSPSAIASLSSLETGAGVELIGLFGVLHHLPGLDSRLGLLAQLARLLAPGGRLAASVWMLHRSPKFARKKVPWQEAAPEVDASQLEEGDTLLGWSGEASVPRYCHFPTEPELAELAALPGVDLVDRFSADGPTGEDNLYLVWERSPT